MTTARFSTKGQIVVPKQYRDAYSFDSGSEVEFVPEADGLKLKPKTQDRIPRTTLAEVSGMLAGRYKGPPLTEEDISRKLAEAARQKWHDELDDRT